MRVQVLGGANALPNHENDTAHFLLNNKWLVDTGWWVMRNLQRFNIPALSVKGIFITHPHVDHVSGLWGLLCHRILYWPDATDDEALFIVCPADGAWVIERMMQLIVDMRPNVNRMALDLRAAEPGERFEIDGCEIATLGANHKGPSLAYRFSDTDTGASAVFSGDTRFMPEMIGFAADCDLLVHDATHVKDQPRELCGSHTCAYDAILVAEKARAKRLWLAHWREHQIDDTMRYVASLNKPFPIEPARPGMEIEL